MEQYAIPKKVQNAVWIAGVVMILASLFASNRWVSVLILATGIALCTTWDGWYLTGVCKALLYIFSYLAMFPFDHHYPWYDWPLIIFGFPCWLLALGAKQFRTPETMWTSMAFRRHFHRPAKPGELLAWATHGDAYLETPPPPPPVHYVVTYKGQ